MKQLTAMILVLAIANPFCCCFGRGKNDSNTEGGSKRVYSCCHQAANDSSDSTPQDDGDTPCKNCPCKKAAVKSEYEDADKAVSKLFKCLSILPECPNMELSYVSTTIQALGFWSRPPPLSRSLHLVHCVFRI